MTSVSILEYSFQPSQKCMAGWFYTIIQLYICSHWNQHSICSRKWTNQFKSSGHRPIYIQECFYEALLFTNTYREFWDTKIFFIAEK